MFRFTQSLAAVAVLAAAAGFASTASAAASRTLTDCALNDITPNAIACSGFYAGNLISGNSTDKADVGGILAGLGLVSDGTWVQKLENLNGTKTLDFTGLLNGTVWIGIHFGNGQNGPGNGDSTAFYKFAASNLDTIGLKYSASSNAALYGSSPVSLPGTVALLGLGLTGLGVLRARRR